MEIKLNWPEDYIQCSFPHDFVCGKYDFDTPIHFNLLLSGTLR